MLTFLYLSLLILGGGYIAITFLVGEVLDFGEDVGHVIEGVSDETHEEGPDTSGGEETEPAVSGEAEEQ
jgi:hypothetical protein